MLSFGISGYLKTDVRTTGVSVAVLLLVAFYIGAMALLVTNEKSPENDNARTVRSKTIIGIVSLLAAGIIFCIMIAVAGKSFILFGYYLIYEALMFFKVPVFCFFYTAYSGFCSGTDRIS